METRKVVSLPAGLASAIEDYRFRNQLETEAETTRRLIECGLTAEPKLHPVRQARGVGMRSSRVAGGTMTPRAERGE